MHSTDRAQHYVTIADLSQFLYKSPQTIRRWINDGKLTAKKAKDGYRIPWNENSDFLSGQLQNYMPCKATAHTAALKR